MQSILWKRRILVHFMVVLIVASTTTHATPTIQRGRRWGHVDTVHNVFCIGETTASYSKWFTIFIGIGTVVFSTSFIRFMFMTLGTVVPNNNTWLLWWLISSPFVIPIPCRTHLVSRIWISVTWALLLGSSPLRPKSRSRNEIEAGGVEW
jgi:hypothetical protein